MFKISKIETVCCVFLAPVGYLLIHPRMYVLPFQPLKHLNLTIVFRFVSFPFCPKYFALFCVSH